LNASGETQGAAIMLDGGPCFNLFTAYPRTATLRNKRPNAETDSEANPHAYQVEFHLFFIRSSADTITPLRYSVA
jgi:hypothetical protein